MLLQVVGQNEASRTAGPVTISTLALGAADRTMGAPLLVPGTTRTVP
jgi:hypothetical protein